MSPFTRLSVRVLLGNSEGIKRAGLLNQGSDLMIPKRFGSGARLGRMALCSCIQVLEPAWESGKGEGGDKSEQPHQPVDRRYRRSGVNFHHLVAAMSRPVQD